MGAAAIAHEYTPRDGAEAGKLGELAAARCKVKSDGNEGNVIIVFLRMAEQCPRLF